MNRAEVVDHAVQKVAEKLHYLGIERIRDPATSSRSGSRTRLTTIDIHAYKVPDATAAIAHRQQPLMGSATRRPTDG